MTFSGSGRWMERVTDSYYFSAVFICAGRCAYHKFSVAYYVEVLRSSAESTAYVRVDCTHKASYTYRTR
jgi:hypothetical protein